MARLPGIAGGLLLFLLALLLSCAPQQQIVTLPEVVTGPSQLEGRPTAGGADLLWKTNRAEGVVLQGYNIYVSRTPVLTSGGQPQLLGDLTPLNDLPYPGDTDPDHAYETFKLRGLDNGERYYVCVTTIDYEGKESAPSNQVEIVPRPEGSFTLTELFSGDNDGYSFRRQQTVETDDLDNDLYLTEIENRLYLASPDRIDGVLRQSEFFPLGRDTDPDQINLDELEMRGVDKVEIGSGAVFLLQDADDCYALVKCESVDVVTLEAQFSFIYQPKPNAPLF